MLKTLGAKNLDEFVSKAAPPEIFNIKGKLSLPDPVSEHQLIQILRKRAAQNNTFKNYIGQGFYESVPINPVKRHILKNPDWYTAYTPYQSELAQGRLEALLNFQTMVSDLTGMDLSNASLLDEASACVEAMVLAFNAAGEGKNTLFVEEKIWSSSLNTLKTRAQALSIEIQTGSLLKDEISDKTFAVLFQYPFSDGSVENLKARIQKLKKRGILVIVSADLLAHSLIEPLPADIAIGSAGRFGLPLMYGGPHPAFLAAKKELARNIPGRLVGVSKDKYERSALRLALQTREQHIRRERATSNICTAQVLPAVMASMYAVYHGAKGLKEIASTIHQNTLYLYEGLKNLNIEILNQTFFDTLTLKIPPEQKEKIKKRCYEKEINLYFSDVIQIAVGEGRNKEDMDELLSIFSLTPQPPFPSHGEGGRRASFSKGGAESAIGISRELCRKSPFLEHPVFKEHQSETRLLRYIYALKNKDLTLSHSMIPLGSCTMKLNAAVELQSMTWKGFCEVHPLAPKDQAQGSLKIFKELEEFLCEITGFSAFSLEPSSGAQGEYLSLLIFRKYHEHKGEKGRDICLIPASAHGTNPASAKAAGLKIVTVPCDKKGCIDSDQLKNLVQKHSKNLSCLMMTYPSTCGVFEEDVLKINALIHEHGGLVYFDGANMNALTGLCRPALMGFDAGHLNLHKTFCIPHGGGGPGSGPLGVSEKLKDFLGSFSIGSTSIGNAGVLIIPWAYIQLMGSEGLKKASQTAILNANYIREKLKPHYRILYTGSNGGSAHECIVDLRKFKYSHNIDVVDVAKRLMDYGFHAPTMSWPVPGTLMIEPTESEDKQELDRFISAMIEIKKEIEEISPKENPQNNVLKNAPHTIYDLTLEKWPFPYSKKKACFPLSYLEKKKFWPPVSRVKDAYGDIHLFCSCPPIDDGLSER